MSAIAFNEAEALRYPLFQDDFGEPGDRVMSDKIATAVKRHECCECLGAINPGERQRVHVGKYAGDMRTYRFCQGCCEAMSRVFVDGEDDLDDEDEGENPMEARWAIRTENVRLAELATTTPKDRNEQ